MIKSLRKSLSRGMSSPSRKLDAAASVRASAVPVRAVSWRGKQPEDKENSQQAKTTKATETDCKMCGDILAQDTCITQCGHRFCRSCIEKQLRACDGKHACETCGNPISMFSVRWCDLQVPMRDRTTTTILKGTIFVQFGQIGLESIHFSEERCYLGYDAKVTPASWKLDNGKPLPSKVEFQKGWTFDTKKRVFKGTVDWAPTSFRGVASQRYEITFDEAFDVVLSGKIYLTMADGTSKDRDFGGDKMQNMHYRRLRGTIYGQSYVRIPNPKESAEANTIVESLSKLGSAGLGIKKENVENMLWSELPLMHFGVFSLHFGEQRSYVDLSMVEGFHPSRIYFENYKFFPATRTFKGETHGDSEWDLLQGRVQWLLHFDDSFERIIWGKIKHYDSNGNVVKEEQIGWADDAAQRYLVVAPWQTLDNPKGNPRFAELEKLLASA